MKAYNRQELGVRYSAYEAVLECVDCCYLLALVEEGMTPEDLQRVVTRAREIYDSMKSRYCTDEDVKCLTSRSPHLIAMKEELKNEGYDYDYEMRQYDTSKSRWHGNNAMCRM